MSMTLVASSAYEKGKKESRGKRKEERRDDGKSLSDPPAAVYYWISLLHLVIQRPTTMLQACLLAVVVGSAIAPLGRATEAAWSTKVHAEHLVDAVLPLPFDSRPWAQPYVPSHGSSAEKGHRATEAHPHFQIQASYAADLLDADAKIIELTRETTGWAFAHEAPVYDPETDVRGGTIPSPSSLAQTFLAPTHDDWGLG